MLTAPSPAASISSPSRPLKYKCHSSASYRYRSEKFSHAPGIPSQNIRFWHMMSALPNTTADAAHADIGLVDEDEDQGDTITVLAR